MRQLKAWLGELGNANRGTAPLIPLGGVMVLALVMLGTMVWQGTARLDEVQRRTEERLIRHAVSSLLESLGRNAREHALVGPHAWEGAELGRMAYETWGYDHVFAVAPGGTTLFGYVDGERTSSPAAEILGPQLSGLVGSLAERLAPSVTGMLRSPSGTLAVGAAAAAANAPDTPILLLGKRLDSSFLGELRDGYGIAAARIGSADSASPGSVRLAAFDGTPVGAVAWQPAKPGLWQLLDLAPVVLAALLVFIGFAALALDNARRAVARLGHSEARFRDVAEAGSDWIWETDAALRLTFLSDHFTRATGIARAAALGQTLSAILNPAGEEERNAMSRHQPFRDILCQLAARGVPTRTLRVAGTPMRAADGAFLGVRGTATDITAEIEAVAQARYLAEHDSLTGLPNRIRLRQAVLEATRRWDRYKTQAAMLCIDLDGFKEVNDSLGHPAGDQLLKACADRLRSSVRGLDLVARLGGDEFAVLMSEIKEPAAVEALCERIVDTIAQPFSLDGHDVIVTASVGAALLPTDADEPDRLMQNADIALYRAKSEGRNRYRFFEPDMEERLRQRKFMEAGLRAALARGQLELHYQPQVATRTGELLGYEALLRWRHPERGLIPPADFIPIAEETGLIIPIGAWVIQQACRDLAGLPGVRVSVNISAVQFRHRELVEIVRSVLKETGVAPECLELEITESVLIANTDEALDILGRLRALGVRLVMDDFGTGYSSLSYLQRFTFDKLKVDRSFVRELADDDSKRVIVRAVVELGHGLGMETCAEGVETEEQRRLLAEEGCTELQGFLIGRPQPREAYAQPGLEPPGGSDPGRAAAPPVGPPHVVGPAVAA